MVLNKSGPRELRAAKQNAIGRRYAPNEAFCGVTLAQCATRREDVARDFVALSTYLGHGHIRHTYWYLEATPDLMDDIAAAAEMLAAEVIA